MELRQLELLVAVVDEGGFTRAAERLHVAQPALSTAIRQLETELGVQLLERTTRNVALTRAGGVVLERARATLASADDTFAVARDAGRGLVGRLRVGVSPLVGRGPLEGLFGACAAKRPGIALHRHEEATDGLLSGLVARELDLVIGWCARPRPGVALEPLRDEPVVAYFAEGHPLGDRDSISLGELEGETVIVGSLGGSDAYTRALMALFRVEGASPDFLPDPYPDAGLLAAAEGLGIAVGAWTGLDGSIKGLRCLPIEPVRTLPFSLAWREDDANPALIVVLEMARDVRDAEGWLRPPIRERDQSPR